MTRWAPLLALLTSACINFDAIEAEACNSRGLCGPVDAGSTGMDSRHSAKHFVALAACPRLTAPNKRAKIRSGNWATLKRLATLAQTCRPRTDKSGRQEFE